MIYIYVVVIVFRPSKEGWIIITYNDKNKVT